MKKFITAVFIIFWSVSSLGASILKEEPTQAEMGVPKFPGSVFVGIDFLDGHRIAIFDAAEPLPAVVAFFESHLPNAQKLEYHDIHTYIVAFLLDSSANIPAKLNPNTLKQVTRYRSIVIEDISSKNQGIANVRAKIMQMSGAGSHEAEIVRQAKTKITVYKIERPQAIPMYTQFYVDNRIQGKWQVIASDIVMEKGNIFEFRADGTYTCRLSDSNIREIARILRQSHSTILRHRVENGTYQIIGNQLTLNPKNIKQSLCGIRRGVFHFKGIQLIIEFEANKRWRSPFTLTLEPRQ